MNYTLSYVSPRGRIDFSLSSGFVLEQFDSPQAVSTAFGASAGARQLGARVETARAEPKTMLLSGVLLGDAPEKRRQLLRVIAPMQKAQLIFDSRCVMDVYPKQSPAVERYDAAPRFSFLLYAPMPYWHNLGGSLQRLHGADGRFAFPWAYGQPLRFSVIRNGYASVPNDGDAPCAWQLTLTALGPVENPRLTKTQTGEYVQLNLTLAAGQTLRLSTEGDEMTAVLTDEHGNQVDVFPQVEIGSTSFWLDAGNNQLAFSPAGAQVQSVLSYRKNYAGV